MADDQIRYDILTQEALRGVVRKVMAEVARTGLPGEHHFFITFATHAPGVRVSSRLLAQYPEEMTIVLQHQYWDLTVNEHAFEVGLSFKGIPERLLIPFTAVKAFTDPSVEFGIRFEIAQKSGQSAERPRLVEDAGEDAPEQDAMPDAAEAVAAGAGAEEIPVPPAEDGHDKPALPAANEAQVVSLDAFRKKS